MIPANTAWADTVAGEVPKRFAFIGGFDCSPTGLEDGLLAKMVERIGGIVVPDVDATLDYLVVGNRRGPSKIALQNRAEKLKLETNLKVND